MVVALHWIDWMWFGDVDRFLGLRDRWRSMCVVNCWIYVWLEGCVTGLPVCGLGCGYDLACGSVS